MTRTRRALGAVIGVAVLALAGCGGGDDDAAATTAAGGTLVVPGSVPGVTTAGGAAPAAGPTNPSIAPTAAPTSTTVAPTVPPTTPAPTAPPAPPCTVVAVGDSVGQDVFNNGFAASLAGVGCELVSTRGARGITMAEGAAALGAAADVPATVAVVVLGYHNAVSQTRSGQFPTMIDDVMAAAGDRTVVWPMLAATADCGPSYTNAAATASQLLVDATSRWPNLVPVDYPSVLAAHPEYSQNRCPHLLNSGSQAIGAWLAGEVRRSTGG